MAIRYANWAVRLTLGMLSIPIMGCSVRPAAVEPFPDPLMAPIPQSPPDGIAYAYPPTGLPPRIELVWRHGTPTGQVPNPHQAERFIVCVYDARRGRCESGLREGVPRPIWLDVAAADPTINRTPVGPERPPFASALDIHLGYEFRTHLRLRSAYRNRRLSWQVGACLRGTCRMSDPRSLQVGRVAEAAGI